MTIEEILSLIGAAFLLLGALFTFIAALGLFRFHELFSRMHAATKPQMLGLMFLCLGIAFTMRSWVWTAACLVVLVIQMIAAPVGSHLLARTAYHAADVDLDYLAVDELAEDEEHFTDPADRGQSR